MRSIVGFMGIGLLAALSAPARADFDELLKRVPPDANSLVLINGQRIAEVSQAARANFLKEYVAAAETCPATLPEGTEQIVMAAQFDIQHMAPQWQLAAIRFGQPVEADAVAERHQGVVDHLADTDVVWIEGASVLVMGEKELAFVTPLNRQSASRWIRSAAERTEPQLSPYLSQAAEIRATQDPDIVMALDLEAVFRPAEIQSSVESSPLFRRANAETIAKIINSIQGVTIVCQVLTAQTCSVHIDFGQDVGPLKPYADPMIRNILKSAGATLEGFEDWEITAEGQRIVLRGDLRPSSLRRILSVYSIGSVVSCPDATALAGDEKSPAPDGGAVDKRTPEQIAAAEKRRKRLATRRYFSSVERRVNDIREDDQMNAANLRQTTYWINNYAAELDRLSVRDVDPEMIEFGAYVSSAFKEMVYQMHSAENRFEYRRSTINPIGETTVTAVPSRRINYGGHIRYQYAPMVTQRLNIGAAQYERAMMWDQEVATGNQAALDILRNVEVEMDKIRQTMNERYGGGF